MLHKAVHYGSFLFGDKGLSAGTGGCLIVGSLHLPATWVWLGFTRAGRWHVLFLISRIYRCQEAPSKNSGQQRSPHPQRNCRYPVQCLLSSNWTFENQQATPRVWIPMKTLLAQQPHLSASAPNPTTTSNQSECLPPARGRLQRLPRSSKCLASSHELLSCWLWFSSVSFGIIEFVATAWG